MKWRCCSPFDFFGEFVFWELVVVEQKQHPNERKRDPKKPLQGGPLQSPVISKGPITPSETGVKYPPSWSPIYFIWSCCCVWCKKIIPPAFKLGKSQKIPPNIDIYPTKKKQKTTPTKTPKANGPSPRFGPPISSPLGLPNSRQHSMPSCHLLDEAIKATASTNGNVREPPDLENCGFWGVPKLASSKKNRV